MAERGVAILGVCVCVGGGAEVEPRGLRLSRAPPVPLVPPVAVGPPVPPAPHRVVCVEATERLCGSHRGRSQARPGRGRAGPAPILWGHKSNHHFFFQTTGESFITDTFKGVLVGRPNFKK